MHEVSEFQSLGLTVLREKHLCCIRNRHTFTLFNIYIHLKTDLLNNYSLFLHRVNVIMIVSDQQHNQDNFVFTIQFVFTSTLNNSSLIFHFL